MVDGVLYDFSERGINFWRIDFGVLNYQGLEMAFLGILSLILLLI